MPCHASLACVALCPYSSILFDRRYACSSGLIELLEEYHGAFSLEEGERGVTDLVSMQIDTGDSRPRRQQARRMPFAVRNEVAKQLKAMQTSRVIQPSQESSSPLRVHGPALL